MGLLVLKAITTLPVCPNYVPPNGTNVVINFSTGHGTYTAPNGTTITALFCRPA